MSELDNSDLPKTPTQPPKARKHVIRTLVASLFGTIALFLILMSILVVWLNQTLTNTSVYVNTVAPLATQPAIQNFVTQKVTSELLTAGSTQNLASGLLPASETAGQTLAQQSAEVQTVISQSVAQVVSSPSFAGLWKSTNQSTQEQLISELDSNSANIALNLHPALLGVFNLLNSTKLAAINSHFQLPSSAGVLSLKGSAIPTIHKIYTYFKDGTWILLAVTLACIGICIWASVHHIKTLRRILIGTGFISLFLASLIKSPIIILNSQNQTGVEQQAILAVINVLLGKLFLACLILGIVCILAAVGSKLYSKFLAKPKTVPTHTPNLTDTPKADIAAPSPTTS